jgi:hypothetical protein
MVNPMFLPAMLHIPDRYTSASDADGAPKSRLNSVKAAAFLQWLQWAEPPDFDWTANFRVVQGLGIVGCEPVSTTATRS